MSCSILNSIKGFKLRQPQWSNTTITFEWISGAKNKAADCLLQLVELPEKHQKNPNGTKPMLINMVTAVTTRNGTRKTPTVKETEKQPPLEINLNKDNTPRTEVSKDTTSNSCKDNPKEPQ